MFRYSTTFYLALWNILCLGLVAVGWAYGFVGPVLADDVSRMSSVCAALLGVVIAYTTYTGFQLDRIVSRGDYGIFLRQAQSSAYAQLGALLAFPNLLKSKVFLYLGLAGTVIGLSLFASTMGHTEASADGIKAIITSMQSSLKTAFNATLVGILCKTWVEVITFIQGFAISDISQTTVDLRARLSMARRESQA